MASSSVTFGGVILCGGRSRRMGRPKLTLPIGNEFLLQRVVRIVGSVVSPVVVVAAEDQPVPVLPPDVEVLRDEIPDSGPLAGMLVGLKSLAADGIGAAYVSGCDTPLLLPAFVRTVLNQLGEHDLAVPQEGDFYHPLAGVYRTSLAPRIERLIAAGRLRPLHLIEECNAVRISKSVLQSVDPELDSLRNANTPEEYQRLLERIRE